MASATDIANLALDILKEAPINSIDEDRPTARLIKRNFEVERDALLEYADWNFAMKRAALPADAEAPAFGWAYAYTLPSDCIRLMPVTADGATEGNPIDHEVEAGRILTNLSGPLKIRYVYRCDKYGTYPATFTLALAARLARKMAHWMTGKTSYVQVAQQLYRDTMEEAWQSDAVQGTWPRAADNEWVDAR